MKRQYGKMEVRDLYFGTDMLSLVVTVFPFSWRGELQWTTLYIGALRTKGQIEGFDNLSWRRCWMGWDWIEESLRTCELGHCAR
jgi:hypothetical protein